MPGRPKLRWRASREQVQSTKLRARPPSRQRAEANRFDARNLEVCVSRFYFNLLLATPAIYRDEDTKRKRLFQQMHR